MQRLRSTSRKFRLRHGATLVAALLGLGLVALWIFGSFLLAAAPARIGAPPADLGAREVDFASDPDIVVHAWFLPGTPGRGAVLLLHGVRANRLAMVERARFLHADGYAVLLIDFRAHGESSGDRISFGWHESRDAAAALAQLKMLAPGERIGVIGASMGGAAAVLADPPLGIDALVLEQVYPTVAVALENRLRLYLGTPGTWLTSGLIASLQPRLGLRVDQLRPIDRLARLSVPKLILAGDRDEHTRLADSLELFAAAAQPKQLWVVPGAKHVDLCAYAGEEYRRRVLEFFAAQLRAPGSVRFYSGGHSPSGRAISQRCPQGSATVPMRQPCASAMGETMLAPFDAARANSESGSSMVRIIQTVRPPIAFGVWRPMPASASAIQKCASSMASWATPASATLYMTFAPKAIL